MDETEDGFDDAGQAAKKFKNILMGFDEINILPSPDSTSGGKSPGGGIGGGLDIDPSIYDYDFLSSVSNEVQEIANRIKSWFADFKENPAIKAIADVFGFLWNKAIKPLGEWLIEHPDFLINFLVAVATAIATYKIVDGVSKLAGVFGGLSGVLTNPWALAIAAVAGAIVFIATSVATARKNAEEADLARRFGEIALSLEEVKFWADKLTTSDLTIKLNLFAEEDLKVEQIKKNIESSIKKLDSYNFKISLGMEIPEADYKSAIEKFVESAKEYIEQRHVVAALAVDILLKDTSQGKNLSEFVSSFYSTTSVKLETLGKQLKSVVNEGFVEGKWIPDKFKEAVKLQKEIQEVLDYISTVEFEAKISALRMDVRGTDLTVDSFKGVLEEAQSTIEDQLSNLEAVRLENIKIAKMEFDQTGNQQAYNEALGAIESEFNKKKLELNFRTFDFGIETLQEAFAWELTQIEPLLGKNAQETFRNTLSDHIPEGIMDAVSNSNIYEQPVGVLTNNLSMAYRAGINEIDVTPEARRNIENLVKEMQPTEEHYRELASSALRAGELIPEGVKRGLTDINKLKAISGSVESQNYMIGQMLSTDTSFLRLLSTSENAGKEIDKNVAEGLANNLKLIKDEATGTVTGIKNSITGDNRSCRFILYQL
ncbi:MAG TPA: hypothetical protein GXX72_06305 [Clostridiaceae bacterium]|nr:hypothetical protein [Clostridiaceae bacterium]